MRARYAVLNIKMPLINIFRIGDGMEENEEVSEEMVCNHCGCIFTVVINYICPECGSMDTSAN